MMRMWYSCAPAESRQMVRDALAAVSPSGRLRFVGDPVALRESLRDEEAGDVGAIVGLGGVGVSDINLGAAIVRDGYADEVVLVAHDVTGSLRSRAACAGISRVVDLSGLSSSVRAAGVHSSGEGGHPRMSGTRAEGEGATPVPATHASAAPVVTLVSGRGGMGKTALCASAAEVAGRWGLRVALCDLDLGNGNLYAYLGLRGGSDLAEVAAGGTLDARRALSMGVSCSENVTLWGPCARPEMAETVAPIVSDLLALLSQSHDLVLVDTSTTCTDAVAQAMQLADRLVIVHGAESEGLSSAARTSALAVRLGVARTRIERIENHCSVRDLGQPFMPRAERGLETARAFRVVDGGEEVGELVRSGEAKALSSADGAFSHSVCVFVAQVLEELGMLPESEEARRFARGFQRKSGFSLFSRMKEAV